MEQTINFFGSEDEQLVWSEELAQLPPRIQLAWAAECLDRLLPCLPPAFLKRHPMAQYVEIAWDVALGASFEIDELERILEPTARMTEIFGQSEPTDQSGLWLLEENYTIDHSYAAAWVLVALVEDWNPDRFMMAAESASVIYRLYQFHRQAIFNENPWSRGLPDTPENRQHLRCYRINVRNQFYIFSRRLYEFAMDFQGEPFRGMFEGIPFPEDPPMFYDTPQPHFWYGFRYQRDIVAWLQEKGKWRYPLPLPEPLVAHSEYAPVEMKEPPYEV
jgi:hypothetical protein